MNSWNRALIAFLIGGVAFAAIAWTGMFWKSKPKGTAIKEHSFRLALPGKWIQQQSSDPTLYSYHTEDGRQNLTVSLVGFEHQMDEHERAPIFNQLVEVRRHTETKVPGLSGVTLTEPSFGEAGEILVARYAGTDSAHDRRFRCLLLGSSWGVSIFYYEALEINDSEMDTRARSIFNSIAVPK